jgi:Divergent InlB B-repeat domain
VPAAAASVRYASQLGSGPQPCLQTAPCDLVTAATGTGADGVANGDQVVVEPGTYSLASELDIEDAINIGGMPGQPLPTLSGAGYLYLDNPDVYLHDLRIVSSATGVAALYMNDGGLAERVFAESTGTGGPYAAGCGVYGAVLRDSVCWGEGQGNAGIAIGVNGSGSFSDTLRNVTTVASTPGGIGLYVSSTGSALAGTINAWNVIARGTADDVEAMTGSGGNSATINLTNSNYATINDSGAATSITTPGTDGNQTAAPVFADAGAGDFHELAESPTIAAGVTDAANGTLDLDGDPRTVNGKTDIGAYELAFTLAVSKSGSGAGSVTSAPAGIDCGTSCTGTFNPDSSVTLTAAPSAGSTFSGWTGCNTTSGSQCTVTVSADRTVSASFTPIPPPPKIKITATKISSKHHRAKFTFKATSKATGFQCALVKKAKKHHKQPKPSFKACRSPKVYKHLKPGNYTFEVRALGAAGTGATAQKSFKIS